MRELISKLFWPLYAPIEFIQNNFKATVFSILILFIFLSDSEQTQEPNLARIYVTGEISNADKFLEEVKHAEKLNVKGVLLIVDSPGGSVAPSVEMAMAVARLKSKNIPVVAYAAGTMASGSYYASIWSNKIIANPGAMIGSIGVIFQGADLSGLMEKLGVKVQTVKMGEYKEAGTPFRQWSKPEKQELDELLKSTYDMFVKDVATARKLDINASDKFANARVFTATQAKQAGLVDATGSIFDAEKTLEELSGVSKPIWMEKSKTEELMDKFMSQAASKLMQYAVGLKAY